MGTEVQGGIAYKNLSASAEVKATTGVLTGIFVASASSSPTIKVWDNTAASGSVLVNTFTPVAGTWYPLPFPFNKALYVEIGGTLDCTVSYS